MLMCSRKSIIQKKLEIFRSLFGRQMTISTYPVVFRRAFMIQTPRAEVYPENQKQINDEEKERIDFENVHFL